MGVDAAGHDPYAAGADRGFAGQAGADGGDAAIVDGDVAFGPPVVERNAPAFDHHSCIRLVPTHRPQPRPRQ